MSGDDTSNASDDGSPFDWCQVDHELTVRDANKIILQVNHTRCVLADGTTIPLSAKNKRSLSLLSIRILSRILSRLRST